MGTAKPQLSVRSRTKYRRGTAYLSILKNSYLAGIENPTSKRYAVITAYNGGAGSVLRVFSSDRDRAVGIINNMSPSDVYQTLTTKHPSGESRRYLYKVNTAQKIIVANSPAPQNAALPGLFRQRGDYHYRIQPCHAGLRVSD